MPSTATTSDAVILRCGSIAVEVLAAGASIRSIRLPGVPHSLILGAADPAVYGAANREYLGATIGRTTNRIAGARFHLDGTEHRLSANEGVQHLHGGSGGFSTRSWHIAERDESRILLTLTSPDGDGGYPGTATVSALVAVEDDGVLSIEYRGTVDRRSILGLTAHLHFNLSGRASARDHVLEVEADSYLPVGDTLIPTGDILAVEGTAFDFSPPRALAQGPDLLDHCFCLRGGRTSEPRLVARLHAPRSGVSLHLATTEAGLQVYDGSYFDGTVKGLDGAAIGPHAGIALEPQDWPNAANEPAFPSVVIDPGERYLHRSVYRFVRT